LKRIEIDKAAVASLF